MPSSVAVTSSAGNSESIAKYVSAAAWSGISSARNFWKLRLSVSTIGEAGVPVGPRRQAGGGIRLLTAAGQQRVAVAHRVGEVDDAQVGAPRLLAQQLERLALVDAVALHEDALRALDRAAALDRALELLDLLGQPRGLLVAAHGKLDRALDLVDEARPRERVDPALRGARDEAGLVPADER